MSFEARRQPFPSGFVSAERDVLLTLQCPADRGLQRDVVKHGTPVAPLVYLTYACMQIAGVL
jgi:hypothetical protein